MKKLVLVLALCAGSIFASDGGAAGPPGGGDRRPGTPRPAGPQALADHIRAALAAAAEEASGEGDPRLGTPQVDRAPTNEELEELVAFLAMVRVVEIAGEVRGLERAADAPPGAGMAQLMLWRALAGQGGIPTQPCGRPDCRGCQVLRRRAAESGRDADERADTDDAGGTESASAAAPPAPTHGLDEDDSSDAE